MKLRFLTVRCAALVAGGLIAASTGCSSSTTPRRALPPVTTAAPSTTTTTLSPAAARAATQVYVRGAGAPLLRFVRETAAFSGPARPTGPTLTRCKKWADRSRAAHLTYRELAKVAEGIAAPRLRQAYGKALLAEWILVSRCQRPSVLTDSQARAAAAARAALLRQFGRAGIGM